MAKRPSPPSTAAAPARVGSSAETGGERAVEVASTKKERSATTSATRARARRTAPTFFQPTTRAITPAATTPCPRNHGHSSRARAAPPGVACSHSSTGPGAPSVTAHSRTAAAAGAAGSHLRHPRTETESARSTQKARRTASARSTISRFRLCRRVLPKSGIAAHRCPNGVNDPHARRRPRTPSASHIPQSDARAERRRPKELAPKARAAPTGRSPTYPVTSVRLYELKYATEPKWPAPPKRSGTRRSSDQAGRSDPVPKNP